MSEVQGLPQWQCHKVVSAFKIVERKRAYSQDVDSSEGFTHKLLGDDGIAVVVGQDYMDRHQPLVGGYFVQYENGHQSFSPAEAFEAGYSSLTPVDPVDTVVPE